MTIRPEDVRGHCSRKGICDLSFLIPAQSDVSDAGFGNEVEEAVHQGKPGSQNRNQNGGAGEAGAFHEFHGGLHLFRTGLLVGGHSRDHEAGDVAHQLTEALGAATHIAELREPVGDERVVNYLHLPWWVENPGLSAARPG